MKLLAFGLMATLVAVALPANAQIRSEEVKPDKTERMNGSKCILVITEKGKEPLKGSCHHVVQTSGSNSLNFHFDSEKEETGITYVVSSKMERERSGRTYYPLIAIVLRSEGKATQPIEASGICTTDNTEMKDLAAACAAEMKDGTKFQSMLIK